MKIQLGVMFGGNSTEHEISIISAVQAMLSLNREKYDVIPFYITKDSRFYTGDALFEIKNYKDIPALLKTCTEVTLIKENDVAAIYKLPLSTFGKKRIGTVEVAFPIVHGTNTEDGVLAGYIEMLGLPYVGCDVASSALGMDKFAMKAIFKEYGIPVLDSKIYTTPDYESGEELIKKIEVAFTYPVIVKPVNLGSSIGISVAADREALVKSLDTAFSFAEVVLVERAITNLREINCSVLGDRFSAEASECEEPVSGDEILSFEDKYISGAKSGGAKGMASVKRKIPAPISPEMREEIRQMAVKAFKALGCSGVSRIDFMIDCDENKVYLNEINTIPGSLSFYLWEPLGVKYCDLLDRMIDLAMKRQRARANLTFSFTSNVLSGISLGGAKGSKM
ncbi:MAG: D-alanine--D-alanine ligase [Ruminococcaceae bacterium]|nr:D-alanine--D-alanine ligase [Oscillospiraceae bacterium]